MGITGNIRTMQISDLLQLLANGRSTGTLVVSNGQAEKSIFFRDGQIVASASTDPREFLGHFLVSHGFISEEQLALAVLQQDRSRALLGKILVDQGAISNADLERMLRLKSEEGIFDLFTWPEGEFRFIQNQLPDYEMVPISLSVTGILLEGMQRLDEWSEIRTTISSSDEVPVSVVASLDDPEIADRDRLILAAVNDDRTVHEICLHCHASEFQVSAFLHRLVVEGKVKMVRPRWMPSTEVVAVAEPKVILDRAEELLHAGDLKAALRHVRAAVALEPDDTDVRERGKGIETGLMEKFAAEGVRSEAVPVLRAALDQLTSVKLSPEEGFILSRINGRSDVASIVKISPIPEVDALLVFWKLVEAGYVVLTGDA